MKDCGSHMAALNNYQTWYKIEKTQYLQLTDSLPFKWQIPSTFASSKEQIFYYIYPTQNWQQWLNVKWLLFLTSFSTRWHMCLLKVKSHFAHIFNTLRFTLKHFPLAISFTVALYTL